MGNLFDYLDWRGDLTFGSVPLCALDALALAVLSYVPTAGVVPESAKEEPMRLSVAASAYFEKTGRSAETDRNHKFLAAAAKTARFGSLRVLAAKQELSRERGIQFSAYSVLLPGQSLYVCFEGTDDTLIGWQEDLRMSYECPVPAQLRATEYLNEVAAAYPLRRILVGGHSKGGNLAMYAAINCGPEVRCRIRRVFNFDGPGFCDGTLSSPAYQELRSRIQSYLPASSIVGVLLEHDTNYRVVKSSAKGLAQHEPLSWQMMGSDFLYATERTTFGRRTEAIVRHLDSAFSPERKKLFAKALFTVLESTKQQTVSGIAANKLKSLRNVLRGFKELDPEMVTVLGEALSALSEANRAVRREEKKQNVRALPSAEKTS